MSLSKRCVETLIDLVDNKLTSMQVFDREDAREIMILETCKRELQALSSPRQHAGGTVVPFARKTAAAAAAEPAQATG
jgi:hypothetical protein